MKGLSLFITLLLIQTLTFSQSEGELSVTVKTSETGGKYAPRNVLAIWVENDSGQFVKTLLAYAEKRKTHLNNWQKSTQNAGVEFNVSDAITGATRSNHSSHNCSWDGNDFEGNRVDDGEYKLCMELTDKNETGNYSTFAFTKNESDVELLPDETASFASIIINWTLSNTSSVSMDKQMEYLVFPSPGSGIIEIIGKDIDLIRIYSTSGKEIYRGKSTSIDLSNQSKGIYIVSIEAKGKMITQNILKK